MEGFLTASKAPLDDAGLRAPPVSAPKFVLEELAGGQPGNPAMGDFAGQKLLVVEKGQSLTMAQLLCLSDFHILLHAARQPGFLLGMDGAFHRTLGLTGAEPPSWGTGPLCSFALNLST